MYSELQLHRMLNISDFNFLKNIIGCFGVDAGEQFMPCTICFSCAIGR